MIYKSKTDLLSEGKYFGFMESVDSIPIFTTTSNLSLLNNVQHVFADGIFLYAPKHFLQLYTVHLYIYVYVCYLPIIFVFMKTKSQQAYIDV